MPNLQQLQKNKYPKMATLGVRGKKIVQARFFWPRTGPTVTDFRVFIFLVCSKCARALYNSFFIYDEKATAFPIPANAGLQQQQKNAYPESGHLSG